MTYPYTIYESRCLFLTFEEYINNPQGKGASNTPGRGMYEQYYVGELDKLLLKVNGKIEYHLYTNHGRFFIKFKIPHHTYPDFYYDAVVEFYTEENSYKVLPDLKKYDVKFYSNDPSFTFTWAYAFNKNNLLIRELRNKCSRQSLTQPPVVRNPSESPGYAKYIYYAYLLTKLYNLFDKAQFTLKGKPLSSLTGSIMSSDAKFQQREKAQRDYAKFSQAKKDNIEHANTKNTLDNTTKDILIGKTPFTNKTRVIDPSNKVIKNTSLVGHVKHTKRK